MSKRITPKGTAPRGPAPKGAAPKEKAPKQTAVVVDGVEHIFSDIDVKAIDDQAKATLDTIFADAEKVFQYAKKTEGDVETVYSKMRKDPQFGNFASTFPLVMRWIIETRSFNPKALKQFFKYYAKLGRAADQQEFLKNQAEYLVYVYRAQHPRASADEIRARREGYVAALLAEDREFMKMREAAVKEVEAADSQANLERRQLLYQQLLRRKVEQERTEPGAGPGAEPGTAPGAESGAAGCEPGGATK